ncbi:MAG TPA: bifunctional diguanylate cyclase/phosphodiesterase [Mycobacteriales bacterium]|nr:bifunctional diguanylate cyclase/phosphodiesterase [Mycobacteriales bacterium]
MTQPHRWQHGDGERLLWAWYLVVGVVAITAYYSLPEAGVGQAAVINAVSFSATLAAGFAVWRSHGTNRTVWVALTIAMVLTTVSNIGYYSYPLATGHALAYPSLVDVAGIASYPCFGIALWSVCRHRRRTERLGDVLDAAILAVSASALTWQFLVAPTRNTTMQLSDRAASVAFPALDVLIFALLARYLVGGGWRNGAIGILSTSCVCLLAANSVYMLQLARHTYEYGGSADGLWMAAYVLLGTAALHPHADRLSEQRPRRKAQMSAERIIFLSLSVLTGPLILLFQRGNPVFVGVVSIVSFVLVMARVTDLNRQLASTGAQLERRATTDPLTGLRNRSAFYDSAIRRLASATGPMAMLFIDIDDFKDVNDQLGHACGDALLTAAGERLRGVIRPDDLVARLGGDEFAVLLQHLTDEAAARRVADRVIAVLTAPFRLAETTLPISASVGVAFEPHRTDIDTLLRKADLAMYSAKGKGKNRVEVYDEDLEHAADECSRLSNEILNAARQDQLVVDYQPLVDLRTRAIIGVEALVRWQHPTRGLLPPAKFIPIAESTGAISDIGETVLVRAARQVRYWQTRYGQHQLCLSVNVSARQVELPGFATAFEAMLRKTGLPPAALVIEVTESVLVNPSGTAAENLAELRKLGVRVAIDDFGTGYSSLGYLRRLPVDILKVDRTFVAGTPGDAQSTAILDGIVTLGHTLELQVIPEGIETPAQLDLLRRLGCTVGQGYLLGRPVSAPEIEDAIASRCAVGERHAERLRVG